MLDIMRKHTGSWLIKVIFAIIILSFVLFFGYSQFRNQGGGKGVAAKVNDEIITYGEYKLSLENATGFYKKMLGGEIPDNMQESIKSTAINQLISQSLFNQLGKKLGLNVTDIEIYEAVSKDPSFKKDGEFDAKGYKDLFLPYFERKYGINYEVFLKKELLAQKTRMFLAKQLSVTTEEIKEEFIKSNTKWSFDRIGLPKVPPEGTKYEQKVEEIAASLLENWKSGKIGNLNRDLKKYQIEIETIKGITVSSNHKLLNGETSIDKEEEIFSLSKKSPYSDKPINSGSYLYLFKLIESDKPSEKDWKNEKEEFKSKLKAKKEQEYLKKWQDHLYKKAKIKVYVQITGQN